MYHITNTYRYFNLYAVPSPTRFESCRGRSRRRRHLLKRSLSTYNLSETEYPPGVSEKAKKANSINLIFDKKD